jgi:YcxB-like protein
LGGDFLATKNDCLKKCPVMQITYELTQKDFTEAYTAHRSGKAFSRWSRRIFISIMVLMALVVLLESVTRPGLETARSLLPLLVLIAMWIGVLWILPWWTMRRQFLQQPGAHGPRALALDDAGAHWKWSGGSSDVEWKNYIRSVEGKNQILFYTSPACFNILPKRSMSPQQLDEIRELLKQNIGVRTNTGPGGAV